MTNRWQRGVMAGLVAGMVGASAPASAGEPPVRQPGPLSPSALERVVRENSRGREAIGLSQQAPVPRQKKDSVLDGALIGAAIGGIGGSALIVAASGGSDNIPRAMLNVAILPALGGFAVGTFIDALR